MMQEVVTEARAKTFEQCDVDEVRRLDQSTDGGVGFVRAVTQASTHPDRDLRNLFEKHGLAHLQEKLCDDLGAKYVQHLADADDTDIETFKWLI